MAGKLVIEYDSVQGNTKITVDGVPLGMVGDIAFCANIHARPTVEIRFPEVLAEWAAADSGRAAGKVWGNVQQARRVVGASVLAPCSHCGTMIWQEDHAADECLVAQVLNS